MKAAAGADVTDPDIVVAELAGLTVSAVADVPLAGDDWLPATAPPIAPPAEIGRASCRERVFRAV